MYIDSLGARDRYFEAFSEYLLNCEKDSTYENRYKIVEEFKVVYLDARDRSKGPGTLIKTYEIKER